MSGRELQYVQEAFASNYIAPAGPMLDAFEAEFAAYTGIAHCVAVASGTAAIHLALKFLNLQDGDEVWASTLTFIGSVVPVVHERLRPVFVDADLKSWTMDPNILAEELKKAAKANRLPKAVIPTDLYGQSCDLDALLASCNEYGIPLICDSAEGVGTRYKNRHAGVGAFASAFSFNGNKIMTASGGGLLASDDKAVIAHARYLSTQAREPVPHYEHLEAGFNYRMSNICAAIGRGQLEVLDSRIERRRAIFESYRQQLGDLPGITLMPEASYGRMTRWLTVIRVDPEIFGADREQIRLALEAVNIEARPVWKPMHSQPVFRDAICFGGDVSDAIFADGLCLPSGSQMTDQDVARVADAVRAFSRAR